jgi:hypothetical protein
MHAKRPEDPAPDGQRPPQPARALPAQVKLAGPFYPVRRADRRPAPITRLSHLAPPAGPRARPLLQLDCSPLHICLPGPAAGAATGHRAPSPGPEPDHAGPVIAVAPGRRSAPHCRPGPFQQHRDVPRSHHQPVPLHQYRATAPLPDTGRSLNHGPVPKTANSPGTPADQAERRHSPPGQSSTRQKRAFTLSASLHEHTVSRSHAGL